MSDTFYDEVVVMDDATYIGVTFTKCRIEYSGGRTATIDCNFHDCELVLKGPASGALHMIAIWGQSFLDNGCSYERAWDLMFGTTKPSEDT